MRLIVFKILCYLIFTTVLSGCSEETESNFYQPKILAHRGCAVPIIPSEKQLNDENSIEAVKSGFHYFDGVEIDIQLSTDGTIWLFHDATLQISDSTSLCIPKSTDQEIKEAVVHSSDFHRLTTLNEVFKFHNDNGLKKHISLDVKGYFDTLCYKNRYANTDYFNRMAIAITSLSKEYEMERYVMVESDFEAVLEAIKNHSNEIETYFLSYRDWTRNINIIKEKGYVGISSNFQDKELNSEAVALARKSGIKVQLWTPNDSLNIRSVINLKPDFIQTDKIFAPKLLPLKHSTLPKK